MLPNLAPTIGNRITKMESVEVEVTHDCIGCGTCQESCFVAAIRLKTVKLRLEKIVVGADGV
jgi:ferredoxin